MRTANAKLQGRFRRVTRGLKYVFLPASVLILCLMARGQQVQTAIEVTPPTMKAILPAWGSATSEASADATKAATPGAETTSSGTATPMAGSVEMSAPVERVVPIPAGATAAEVVKPVSARVGSAQEEDTSDGAETLHLLLGRSLVITSPARVTRVSVADPDILDAMVVDLTQVLIDGKAPGVCSLVLWDEYGQSHTYDVYVELDLRSLTRELKNTFPNEDVRAEAENDSVVLMGQATTQAVADKMLEIAKAVTPKAVSVIQVPTPTTAEILLQVKFAEVDTGAITQLGLNILSLPGAKNVGSISTQQFSGPQLPEGSPLSPGGPAGTTGYSLSSLLNIFYFRPDLDLGFTIQALEQKNVLEILAEPNVLTQSGKDASFLSGGEFPYPVVQGTGSGLPTVSIQFKEYGVRLDFTPTVMSDGIIHLKVRPEVSSLDYTNAVTLDGFTVPALSTRRVEAEMDLRDGQSFAIAGLINDQITDQLEKIPGLGDIPLFGKLFQSRNLNKTKNELLILVTPRIVNALPAGSKLPEGPNYPIRLLPPASPAKGGPADPKQP